MDALKYIDSKDIRNYLEEIEHEFSPVEAAWLVWQCENITFEESLTAYLEIIDTLPDVPISKGEYKSLHELLQAYIS